MTIMRFSHTEEVLEFKGKKYRATCAVRNELNNWRKDDEVTNTMPKKGVPSPYYPRKFPTGLWRVSTPEYTDDSAFAPVKIPTNATRRVILWNVCSGEYAEPSGDTQVDAYYHLHYAENSNTTLGCIRLDSAEDAKEIAKNVIMALLSGAVWLEVVV